MPRVLSGIKSLLVPSGKRPRTIKGGEFKGLAMRLDLRSQTQVWLGLSEREVFSYLRTFAQRARTGIDIGAAEGEYALYFLSRPNMKHVLAFDPSEGFPREINENLALNGFRDDRRAILKKQYVTNFDDETHCTLDSAAADLEGPFVVKIDVDGGEAEVLKGAARLLGRDDVGWIIETHSIDLERECEGILKASGLKTSIVKNAWWRTVVPEVRPCAHNRWLVAWR